MVINGISFFYLFGSDNDVKKVSTLFISLFVGLGRVVIFSDFFCGLCCIGLGWDRVGFRCCVVDRRYFVKLFIMYR